MTANRLVKIQPYVDWERVYQEGVKGAASARHLLEKKPHTHTWEKVVNAPFAWSCTCGEYWYGV